jgi:hypothetical protein
MMRPLDWPPSPRALGVTLFAAVLLAIGIGALATAADSPDQAATNDPGNHAGSVPPNPADVVGPARPTPNRSSSLKACPPAGSKEVNFSAYYVGSEFRGHSLKKRLRICNEPYPDEPVRGNYISYLYGDCEPPTDGGCPYPLEVQTAPACEWNPSVFSPHLHRESLRVRGVPAAYLSQQKQLQLYTGDATVDIYGHDKEQILDAAESLRSVPEDQRPEKQPVRGPGVDLPAPARGAIEDELPC